MTRARAEAVAAAALALLAAAGCSSDTPGEPDAGFSAPPTSVDAGTLVRFRVNVNDAGTVVLRHGPYGMQVDADGTVTWKAELPLFEQALDVHWSVKEAGSDAGVAGTIRVIDRARTPTLLRSSFEIPRGHAGLRVIDLDGDGTDEALIAGRTGLYSLGRRDGGYAQTWMLPFPPGIGEVSAVAAADLDGDRRPEIALSMNEVLVVLDGATRRERGRVDLPVGRRCDDLEFADLDRDGEQELICLEIDQMNGTLPGRLRVFDALSLALRWETQELALGGSLAVGNVDADPALELVTSGGFVFDGASHSNDWTLDGGFGDLVAVGDLDGDGVAEIVGVVRAGVGAVRGYSAVLQTPLWEKPVVEVEALLLVDLDGDGRSEILTGDGQWGNVTAERYVPATNSLATLWFINSQDYGVSALGAGDLDGDRFPEVIWGTGRGSTGPDKVVVAGRDAGMAVRWTNSDPIQLDGPFVGGKLAWTAPGVRRLVFEVPRTNSGYGGARLVSLDPVSGAWSATPELGNNWSQASGLEVADLDGDGADEAFLGTADYYSPYLGSWSFAQAAPALGLPSGTLVALTKVELNGDGHLDFAGVNREGITRCWDFWNHTFIWESAPEEFFGPGQAVAAVDLDQDGVAEIIALFERRLSVFRRTTSSPPTYVEQAWVSMLGAYDMVVADLDGDGKPEIAVLAGAPYAPAMVSRFSATLDLLGQFEVDEPAQSLAFEDLGPGRRNLIVGIGDPPSHPQSYLRAVDPVSGAEIWRSPSLWSPAMRGSLGYHDLDDGRRTLAFGTWLGMYVVR